MKSRREGDSGHGNKSIILRDIAKPEAANGSSATRKANAAVALCFHLRPEISITLSLFLLQEGKPEQEFCQFQELGLERTGWHGYCYYQ